MSSIITVPGLSETGSIVVAHGLSCSAACEIFPGQEMDPCLLHRQVDSLLLSYQGSPHYLLLISSLNPLCPESIFCMIFILYMLGHISWPIICTTLVNFQVNLTRMCILLLLEYCCSVAKLCPTLCDPVDWSTPDFLVLHYLPEFAWIHVHWVSDAVVKWAVLYFINFN